MTKYPPRIVVFFDIDKTIRWGKDPPSQETADAILEFLENGGLPIPITGGPLKHVPTFLLEELPIVFAESGAIGLVKGEEKLFASAEQLWAIDRFLGNFSIAQNDGFASLDGYEVFLEGPRKASITLVTGRHPDCPQEINTPIEIVRACAGDFIRQYKLPLTTRSGTAEVYAWEDLNTLEKEDMVAAFCGILDGRSYFVGDGLNDLKAMYLSGVIPVAVGNSIDSIKQIARQRGLSISLAGPDGGTAQLFCSLSRELCKERSNQWA